MTKVKNLFKNSIYALLALVMGATLVTAAVPANAQIDVPDRTEICEGGVCPLTGDRDFASADETTVVALLIDIAEIITYIAVGVAVLFLVYGGFLFIVDPGGSGDGATKGKTIIFNALIGLVIAIVAFTIVQIVANFVTGTTIFSG